MGLINQTIPGLYNGVSQQPDELRLDTQVSEMINCHPTLVQGTQKRSPTVHKSTDNTVPTDAFVHVYDRGAGDEQYIIVVKDGFYKIYDENGVDKQDWNADEPVPTYPIPYLQIPAGAKANESFSAVTVGDTTFIVNKTKTVAMDSATSDNGDPNWDTTFFYWIKRTTEIRYGTNNGSAKGYTYYIYNASGSLVGTYEGSDGVNIATDLATDIGGTSHGSVVRKTGAASYSGADSWGNQASEAWVGKARKLQDLPGDLGYDGAVIEVTGDDKSGFDNFYVKFSDGVYLETYKPNQQNSINNSTMPHKIERASTTSFPMSAITWTDRTVGDSDSASEPSFVGKTLDDVFFFKNRLGLLSADNIVMSETGEFYNFFPTTVTDVLDSDPIDVAVDSNKAVYLRYAVPFNKELLVFGDKAQFILSSAKALTPKDVNVQQSTAYDINKNVEPITLGPNVYFTTDKSTSSIVREYFTVPDTANNDAANITAHCPHYVPNGLTKMTGSSKHDMLFAITGTNNKIYVYNYYWQGEEKAQSAWHTWELEAGATVFNIEVLDSTLLIMLQHASGGDVALESISLELPTDITSITYADHGATPVSSTISLSKWGVPSGKGNVDSNRSSLVLRDLRLSMGDNSYYGLKVTRGTVTNTWLNYDASTMLFIGDHKFPVLGNANNLDIDFVSTSNKGFKLNSLSWRGQLHLKGSQGV
mgnify:FL=1|jgi:hypothetical protein